MTISNPIYENAVIEQETIAMVKGFIDCGFYKFEEESKKVSLRILLEGLSLFYEVPSPHILFEDEFQNQYLAGYFLVLKNTSIVSFLHEFRHHLQNIKKLSYVELTPEQDARAWSLKIMSEASPKNFIKSVKAGRISHIAWSEEENRVVDNCTYI